MAKAYLILGSNIGKRKKNLEGACILLNKSTGHIIKKSAIYETEPWGVDYNTLFLNQVIELETAHDPWTLLSETKLIELSLGRTRSEERYAPRTLDIDILFYDTLVVESPQLTIPHPQIQYRRFVLEPMREVAPNLEHPLLKKSIKELLDECIDPKRVIQLPK